MYSDACDVGIACILQQIQPIKISDLKGTKIYEHLKDAHDKGQPIPSLVMIISKNVQDVPQIGNWENNFDDTIVHIERVISYWSRTLKSAERNYSPTEREALALKDGLVKFQPFIEGEQVIAVTDHAALIWTKTFQNVNQRLLSWGTVFAAYPNLHIVHRAGRVHSNVDPISRLQQRIPYYEAPLPPNHEFTTLSNIQNDEIHEIINSEIEQRILTISKKQASQVESPKMISDKNRAVTVHIKTSDGLKELEYPLCSTFNIMIHVNDDETKSISESYDHDSHFALVKESLLKEKTENISREHSSYPQYVLGKHSLIYFRDWSKKE